MLPVFSADSSSHEEKSHTVVATETRDVVTSAGGRDDDSDVEIDLESVEEGDQLNSSDDKTEGNNSTKQNFTKSSKDPFTRGDGENIEETLHFRLCEWTFKIKQPKYWQVVYRMEVKIRYYW